MVIEFARNVCGLTEAEFDRIRSGDAAARDLQTARIEGHRRTGRHHAAGRVALRAQAGQLRAQGVRIHDISERHRHRYEFNREFEQILTSNGLRITGETPDGTYVEICEIEDHPWYLGCQFHPEFKSKPLEPHPLFSSFIGGGLPFPRASPRRRRSAAAARTAVTHKHDAHSNTKTS